MAKNIEAPKLQEHLRSYSPATIPLYKPSPMGAPIRVIVVDVNESWQLIGAVPSEWAVTQLYRDRVKMRDEMDARAEEAGLSRDELVVALRLKLLGPDQTSGEVQDIPDSVREGIEKLGESALHANVDVDVEVPEVDELIGLRVVRFMGRPAFLVPAGSVDSGPGLKGSLLEQWYLGGVNMVAVRSALQSGVEQLLALERSKVGRSDPSMAQKLSAELSEVRGELVGSKLASCSLLRLLG